METVCTRNDRMKFEDPDFDQSLDDEVEQELEAALSEDDKEEFIWIIFREVHSTGASRLLPRRQSLLHRVCSYNAYRCATALLKGETSLSVDVNLPCFYSMMPLHFAAQQHSPVFTKLFIYYGARTDVRVKSDVPECNHMLPLHIALDGLSCIRLLSEWTPKQSIYKLLTMLCLPDMRNTLETIGLLAWKTKETEDEIFHLARDGKIMELAALLMVARNKLINRFRQVCNSIQNNDILIEEDKREAIAHVVTLFEVFEKAGDAVETYLKQEKPDATEEQVMQEVANLLGNAGCTLKPRDTDLRDYTSLRCTNLGLFYTFGMRTSAWITDLGPSPTNAPSLSSKKKHAQCFVTHVRSAGSPTTLREETFSCNGMRNAIGKCEMFSKPKGRALLPMGSFMIRAMKRVIF